MGGYHDQLFTISPFIAHHALFAIYIRLSYLSVSLNNKIMFTQVFVYFTPSTINRIKNTGKFYRRIFLDPKLNSADTKVPTCTCMRCSFMILEFGQIHRILNEFI